MAKPTSPTGTVADAMKARMADAISGFAAARSAAVPPQAATSYSDADFNDLFTKGRRAVPQADLARYNGDVNAYLWDNAIPWAKRAAGIFRSAHPAMQQTKLGEYQSLFSNVNQMLIARGLSEIGVTGDEIAGSATAQLSNLFGVLPKVPASIEQWAGLSHRRVLTGVNPETGDPVPVGDEDGEIPISQLMGEAADAVMHLDKAGMGGKVPPELRKAVQTYFGTAVPVAGAVRTLAEFAAVRKAAARVNQAAQGLKGPIGGLVGRVSEQTLGRAAGGGNPWVATVALGAAHGAAGGALGATQDMDKAMEARRAAATPEEIEAAGGWDSYVQTEGRKVWPRLWHVMSSAGTGAAHGAVAMAGWATLSGGVAKMAKGLYSGPTLSKAASVLQRAGEFQMPGFRGALSAFLQGAARTGYGVGATARVAGKALTGGLEWVAGSKGAEFATNALFGVEDPEYVKLISENPLVTFALGAFFHGVPLRKTSDRLMAAIRSGTKAPGIEGQAKAELDGVLRQSGDKMLGLSVQRLRENGHLDSWILDNLVKLHTQGKKPRDDVLGALKQGLSAKDWAAMRAETARGAELMMARMGFPTQGAQAPAYLALPGPGKTATTKPVTAMDRMKGGTLAYEGERQAGAAPGTTSDPLDAKFREAGISGLQEAEAKLEALQTADDYTETTGFPVGAVRSRNEALRELESMGIPTRTEDVPRFVELLRRAERIETPEGILELAEQDTKARHQAAAFRSMTNQLEALLKKAQEGTASPEEIDRARSLRVELDRAKAQGAKWNPPGKWTVGPDRAYGRTPRKPPVYEAPTEPEWNTYRPERERNGPRVLEVTPEDRARAGDFMRRFREEWLEPQRPKLLPPGDVQPTAITEGQPAPPRPVEPMGGAPQNPPVDPLGRGNKLELSKDQLLRAQQIRRPGTRDQRVVGAPRPEQAKQLKDSIERKPAPTEAPVAGRAAQDLAYYVGRYSTSGASYQVDIRAKDVIEDPTRFQFRSSRSEAVTGEWRTELGGDFLLWRDKAGKLYVVDGHHRLPVAKRADAKIKGIVLDEAKVSARDAMGEGALRNLITSPDVDPLDIARMLRAWAPKDDVSAYLKAAGVSTTMQRTKLGIALAKLPDGAFDMVRAGEVEIAPAAAIANELAATPAQLMKAMAKASERNAAGSPMSGPEATSFARQLKSLTSKTETASESSMFGDEVSAVDYAEQYAKLERAVIGELTRERSAFRTVLEERSRLESGGTSVDVNTAEGRHRAAERLWSDVKTYLDQESQNAMKDLFREGAEVLSRNPASLNEVRDRIISNLGKFDWTTGEFRGEARIGKLDADQGGLAFERAETSGIDLSGPPDAQVKAMGEAYSKSGDGDAMTSHVGTIALKKEGRQALKALLNSTDPPTWLDARMKAAIKAALEGPGGTVGEKKNALTSERDPVDEELAMLEGAGRTWLYGGAAKLAGERAQAKVGEAYVDVLKGSETVAPMAVEVRFRDGERLDVTEAAIPAGDLPAVIPRLERIHEEAKAGRFRVGGWEASAPAVRPTFGHVARALAEREAIGPAWDPVVARAIEQRGPPIDRNEAPGVAQMLGDPGWEYGSPPRLIDHYAPASRVRELLQRGDAAFLRAVERGDAGALAQMGVGRSGIVEVEGLRQPPPTDPAVAKKHGKEFGRVDVDPDSAAIIETVRRLLGRDLAELRALGPDRVMDQAQRRNVEGTREILAEMPQEWRALVETIRRDRSITEMLTEADLAFGRLVAEAARTEQPIQRLYFDKAANLESRGRGRPLDPAAIELMRGAHATVLREALRRGWIEQFSDGRGLTVTPAGGLLGEMFRLAEWRLSGGKRRPTEGARHPTIQGDNGLYTRRCSDCWTGPLEVAAEGDKPGLAKRVKEAFKRAARAMRWQNAPVPAFVQSYLQQLTRPELTEFKDGFLHWLAGSNRNRWGDPTSNIFSKGNDFKALKREEFKTELNEAIRDYADVPEWGDIADINKLTPMQRAKIDELRDVMRALEGAAPVPTSPAARHLFQRLVPIRERARKMAAEHVFAEPRREIEKAIELKTVVPAWVQRRWRAILGTDQAGRLPSVAMQRIRAAIDHPPGTMTNVEGMWIRAWGLRDYHPHLYPKDKSQGDGLKWVPWGGYAEGGDTMVTGKWGEPHAGFTVPRSRVRLVQDFARQHGLVRSRKWMRNLLARMTEKDGYIEDPRWVFREYLGSLIDKIAHDRMMDDLVPHVFGDYKPLEQFLETPEGFAEALSKTPRETDGVHKGAFGGVDPYFSMKVTRPDVGERFVYDSIDRAWKRAETTTDELLASDRVRWQSELWRWGDDATLLGPDPTTWQLAISTPGERFILRGIDQIRAAGIQVRDGGIANFTTGRAYTAMKDLIRKFLGYDLETGAKESWVERSLVGRAFVQMNEAMVGVFNQAMLGGSWANLKPFIVQMIEGSLQNLAHFDAKGLSENAPAILTGGGTKFFNAMLHARDPRARFLELKEEMRDTPFVKEILPILEAGEWRPWTLLRTDEQLLRPPGTDVPSKIKEEWGVWSRRSYAPFNTGDIITKTMAYVTGYKRALEVREWTDPHTGRTVKIVPEFIPSGDLYTRGRDVVSAHDIARMGVERAHFSLHRTAQPGLVQLPGWRMLGHLGTTAANVTFEMLYGLGEMVKVAQGKPNANAWMAASSARYLAGIIGAYTIMQAFGWDIGDYVGEHVSDFGFGNITVGSLVPQTKAFPEWVRLWGYSLPTKAALPFRWWFGREGEGVITTMGDTIARAGAGVLPPLEAAETATARFWRTWAPIFMFGPGSRTTKHFINALYGGVAETGADEDRPFEVRNLYARKQGVRYRSLGEFVGEILLPGRPAIDSQEFRRSRWAVEEISIRGKIAAELRRRLIHPDVNVREDAAEKLRKMGKEPTGWRTERARVAAGLTVPDMEILQGQFDVYDKARYFIQMAPKATRVRRERMWQAMMGPKRPLGELSPHALETLPADLRSQLLELAR